MIVVREVSAIASIMLAASIIYVGAAGPSLAAELDVLGAKCWKQRNYWRLEGQVRNTSDRPLQFVQAVGMFTDTKGEFVKTDHAFIQFDPLLPGQTSPFRIMTDSDPSIANCELEFGRASGPKLSHTYKGK